jgi:hypothetical protein
VLMRMVTCQERVWLITSPPSRSRGPDNKVQWWFQGNWHTFDTREFNG